MKKKLLAAAVVGALASPAAMAQTLYGLVDLGYQNADYSDGDVNNNFIQSGMHSGSRFGVRGSEDLAGGTYAMYQIEFNIQADSGDPAATGTQRLTLVGLGNKGWGELTLGQQYTHTFHTFAVGSSIGYGTFATMYGNTGIQTRASNSVKYSSPNFNGFTIGALWAPGEDTTDGQAGNGNYMDFAVRYTPGPFGIAVSHAIQTIETAATAASFEFDPATGGTTAVAAAPAVDADVTHTQVAGHWNAGPWGVYGAWQMIEEDETDAEADIWHINGVFRFGGRHELHALFGHSEAEAGGVEAEGDVWGIAWQYLMSKRSRIYAGYGSADNDAGVGLKPTGLAGGTPSIDDPSGFQIGLLHTF